eukprot:m.41968 g.41968  ORF g.41968 m.41968 type:complete len:537 (-) comp10634_c0_seq2:212-1822(-)
MQVFRARCSTLVLLALCVSGAVGLPTGLTSSQQEVYVSMTTTYYQGITQAVADYLVGAEDVPFLITLLQNDSFPRPDNVVACLAYINASAVQDSAADGMFQFLKSTTRTFDAATTRAAFLVPSALGILGQNGSANARAHLTEMLSLVGSSEDVVNNATRRMRGGAAARRKLAYSMYVQAMKGLNMADNSALLTLYIAQRLNLAGDILDGNSLISSAQFSALLLRLRDISGFSLLRRNIPESNTQVASPDLVMEHERSISNEVLNRERREGERTFLLTRRVPSETTTAPLTTTESQEPNAEIHKISMGWCYHTALEDTMTEADINLGWEHATNISFEVNFEGDQGCCLEWENAGSGGAFGTSTDELDIIDNQEEMDAVLEQSCGRMKFVNTINWCGETALNVIGCAYIGGTAHVVVKLNQPQFDARLWVHEVGHTVGLGHNSNSSRYIMYGAMQSDNDLNNGLTPDECSQFINPAASSGLKPTEETGECTVIFNGGSGSASLDTPQIIGIALGAVAGVVLIAVIIALVMRKGKNNPI